MMKVKNILAFVFLTTVFSPILVAQTTNEIEIQHLESILKQIPANCTVLDVRTEQEYHQGYIAGAKNYNYLAENFKEKVAVLDKNKTYYVYCFSGGRSSQAVADMQALGFTKVINVRGGIRAWTQAGYDIKNE